MDSNDKRMVELLEALREEAKLMREAREHFSSVVDKYYTDANKLLKSWDEGREQKERTYESRYQSSRVFQHIELCFSIWFFAISLVLLRFLIMNW